MQNTILKIENCVKALGWTYDSEEKPYMVNTEPDIVTPTKFGLW